MQTIYQHLLIKAKILCNFAWLQLPNRALTNQKVISANFLKLLLTTFLVVVGDETSCLEATRSLETVPGFKALLKTYKKWKKGMRARFQRKGLFAIIGQFKQQETKESDPKLVFLGTGSAIPSKYRNGMFPRVLFAPLILLQLREYTLNQCLSRAYYLMRGRVHTGNSLDDTAIKWIK